MKGEKVDFISDKGITLAGRVFDKIKAEFYGKVVDCYMVNVNDKFHMVLPSKVIGINREL